MFQDRTAAGRQLADALRARGWTAPIVLALPRGGVPVGVEIAETLGAPMDVLMVRKLGAPGRPELAMGAVAKTGESVETVLNDDVVQLLGIRDEAIARTKDAELRVIQEREQRYNAGRTRPGIQGRTAIVVDDGIATGATMRAALRAARRAAPARVVLAVPVAPPDAVRQLSAEADEVVCLAQPWDLGAIGMYYRDFRQVDDQEVVAALARYSAPGSGAA
jgi:putative phosphoribosyl transferase